MNIKRVGIDLAKQIFQVHGVDDQEKVVLRKQLRRAQMLGYFKNMQPCLIGMEACSGSHYWGRELQKLGHTVKLVAPQFVKPYVKSNKNDANDAESSHPRECGIAMRSATSLIGINKGANRLRFTRFRKRC